MLQSSPGQLADEPVKSAVPDTTTATAGRRHENRVIRGGMVPTNSGHRLWQWRVLEAVFYLVLSIVVTYPSVWLCINYALYLSALLAVCGIAMLGSSLINGRVWVCIMPGALLCLCLIAPGLLAQRKTISTYQMVRPDAELCALSARLSGYCVVPWSMPLARTDVGSPTAVQADRIALSPGYVKMALAGAGLWIGLAVPRLRAWTLYMVLLLLGSVLLSLGMQLYIGNWQPYAILVAWVPGFAQVRGIFRAGVFAQLTMTFLAAQGLLALAVPCKQQKDGPGSEDSHCSQGRYPALLVRSGGAPAVLRRCCFWQQGVWEPLKCFRRDNGCMTCRHRTPTPLGSVG